MAEVWNRLFAPIEGEGSATTDYYGADLLNLSGAISLGDEIVFTVDAPPAPNRYYWRSRVFERYAEGQWSPSADLRITDRTPPLEVVMKRRGHLAARAKPCSNEFTVGAASSRIYYAAPQPFRIEGVGKIDLIYTDSPTDSSMNVSVIRPLKAACGEAIPTPLAAWSARHPRLNCGALQAIIRRGSADPTYMSASGIPAYLNLALQIVNEAGAAHPYDRAKAIESWLRESIAYNESISAPPPGVDTVEWVLFDAREGYCTYYATSMIVMLRHLGIPARLAAGFSQGAYDRDLGRYVVREREAHTWVEVYFPGYGWIEFEPTSAQAPIQREGDDQAGAG